MQAFSERDAEYMSRAIALARQASQAGEVPVGAVLVYQDEIIAEAYNQPISENDPTAHAEIQVLRKGAKQLGNYRLPETELFVTIEPCLMCAGALVHARVKRLVFGAREPKAGAVRSQFQCYESGVLNHQIQLEEGLLKDECADLMRQFFKQRREA